MRENDALNYEFGFHSRTRPAYPNASLVLRQCLLRFRPCLFARFAVHQEADAPRIRFCSSPNLFLRSHTARLHIHPIIFIVPNTLDSQIQQINFFIGRVGRHSGGRLDEDRFLAPFLSDKITTHACIRWPKYLSDRGCSNSAIILCRSSSCRCNFAFVFALSQSSQL